jgi:hypothetical protein
VCDEETLKREAKGSSWTICTCERIDLQRMNNFIMTIFVKNQKYKCGGEFKLKVHVLFYGDRSRISALTDKTN